ncbi:MAG: IMP cyclohydrolase [Erysipelotrichaceae bacterium]|nr:IMP cyclohydrolase [Erysipelotrichaceae bacterium]
MIDLFEYLRGNEYPGRGIIAASYEGKAVLAYFIMGRSENSRNRVFEMKGDELYTRAFDESKVEDPSLIIYNCLRKVGNRTVLTNGNQTDTICQFLEEGKDLEDALATREYEPDAPSYTPRISALFDDDRYTLSILKRVNGECAREFFDYQMRDRVGHFISTYAHDGDPLPSFKGRPLVFELDLDIHEFADHLWESLNKDNRISLYVRYFDDNSYEDVLINKNS